MNKRWQVAGIVATLATILCAGWLFIYKPVTVSLEVWSEGGDRVEVFWGVANTPYTAERSHTWNSAPARWLEFTTTYHTAQSLAAIRVDPTMLPGEFRLRAISVSSRWRDITWHGNDLIAAIEAAHEIDAMRLDDDGVLIATSAGRDPHFTLQMPEGLYRVPLLVSAAGLALTWVGFLWVAWLIYPLGSRVASCCRDRLTAALLMLALLGVVALAAVQWRIAEITPPMQAPDEITHIANSFDGFYQLLGAQTGSCPLLWDDLIALREVTDPMVRYYTVQVTPERVAALNALEPGRIPPIDGVSLISTTSMSCSLTNWFHSHAANAYPLLKAYLGSEFTPSQYLQTLRQGHVLLSLVLISGVILAIVYGRFVFDGLITANVPVLRLSLVLAVLVYLAMPQNLFMLGSVSREAYMLPLGMFAFVSLVFRIPVFTPLMLILSVYAFWPRRAPYLMPVALVFLTYFAVWLRSRGQNGWVLWLPVVAVLGAFLATPWLLMLLDTYRAIFPFRIPSPLIPVEDPLHFFSHVYGFLQLFFTLELFEWRNYFGLLGSMDAPVAGQWQALYRYVLLAGIYLGLLGLAVRFFMRHSAARINRDELAIALIFLLAVPLLAAVITYTGHHVYTGGRREFGWGVQGRYFQPVYFFVVALTMAAFFSPFLFFKAAAQGLLLRLQAGWVVLGGLAVVFLMVVMSIVTMDTLIARYYLDGDTLHGYLQWLNAD